MGTSARLSTEAESNDEEDLIAVFDSEDPLRAPDSSKWKKKKKKKTQEEKLNQQFISLGNSYFLFGRLNKTHGIVAKLKSEVLNRKKMVRLAGFTLGNVFL